MVDSRRWLTALAVPLLFAGLASAQVTGGGGTQLTCSVNTSNTPTLRSEGITEQVGDIVITCTGGPVIPNIGTGAAANPLSQAVNITISLTSQVTSRLLASSTVSASEALLMIDEPNSGLAGPIAGFGPTQPFTPCPTPGSTQNGCAGPTSPTPAYVLTQTAGGVAYQTSVTSATAAPGAAVPAPNVYQGVVSGNQVTFYGVPVTPPGTSGARVFRITNVRVNASGIGGGSASGSLPVQASILTSNPSALPISNPTPIVGFVQASLSTSTNGPIAFGQCNSQTLAFTGAVTFKELFASAFKTRVDPTVPGQTGGTPTPGQGSVLVQNKPGTIYNSESGFTLGGLPTGAVPAGLADFGTRLTAVFNNIPAGARVFVSQYNVTLDPVLGIPTGQVISGNSFAQAISGETVADGATGAPTLPASAGPPATAAAGVNYVEITPSTGSTATASWEVMATQPTALDTLNFAVYITYIASPGTNTPAAGTGTVNLRYGPASTVTTASGSANVPRFLDTSSAKNIISIGICRTILLYPFVTNQAGFDTGLAIANTTTDPFGTTPQTGTCALNWYGAAAPPPTTTPTIATATDWAGLTSIMAPGFQGYMIAVCNFQFAHGFAFISDVGATKLAEGYLALVVPDPNLNAGRKANDQAVSAASSGEQLSN